MRRTNKLRDFFQQSPPPMTKQELADRIGCSGSYISQLCRDRPPWPGRVLARRIFEETGIRPDHWAGLEPEERTPGDLVGPSLT